MIGQRSAEMQAVNIYSEFLRCDRERWTGASYSVCGRCCSRMGDCKEGIRESTGKTNPFPAI